MRKIAHNWVCCQVWCSGTLMRNTYRGRCMLRLKVKEIAEQKGYNQSTLSRASDVPINTIRRIWRNVVTVCQRRRSSHSGYGLLDPPTKFTTLSPNARFVGKHRQRHAQFQSCSTAVPQGTELSLPLLGHLQDLVFVSLKLPMESSD